MISSYWDEHDYFPTSGAAMNLLKPYLHICMQCIGSSVWLTSQLLPCKKVGFGWKSSSDTPVGGLILFLFDYIHQYNNPHQDSRSAHTALLKVSRAPHSITLRDGERKYDDKTHCLCFVIKMLYCLKVSAIILNYACCSLFMPTHKCIIQCAKSLVNIRTIIALVEHFMTFYITVHG